MRVALSLVLAVPVGMPSGRSASTVDLPNPLEDQLIEQGMRPERRAEPEVDMGVPGLKVVAGGGQVAEQVDAGREEVGDHQDPGGTACHAAVAAAGDIGLGQLEEARLDDRILDPERRAEPQAGAGRCWPRCRLPWAISRTATVSEDGCGSSLVVIVILIRNRASLRQHERRADRRRHGRVGPLDRLPDDLVEHQVVGAVLDLQVRAASRALGPQAVVVVLGLEVDPGRAVDVGREVGRGS